MECKRVFCLPLAASRHALQNQPENCTFASVRRMPVKPCVPLTPLQVQLMRFTLLMHQFWISGFSSMLLKITAVYEICIRKFNNLIHLNCHSDKNNMRSLET